MRAFALLRETIDVYGTTDGNLVTFAIFALSEIISRYLHSSRRLATAQLSSMWSEDHRGSDSIRFAGKSILKTSALLGNPVSIAPIAETEFLVDFPTCN